MIGLAESVALPAGPPPERDFLEPALLELFRCSPDLFCLHTLDGSIVDVNPAVSRALGYPVEQLRTMNLRDILTDEACAGWDEYMANLKSRRVASGMMIVRTAAGSRRVWQYENVLTGDARPVVCGIGRDVTEEEVGRQTLQSSERHFRLLAENNPDVIAILDGQGVIRYHSPSAVNALRCGPDAILAAPLVDLVAEEDRPKMESALLRVATGEGAQRIDVSLIRQPGRRRSFEVILTPLVQRKKMEGVLVNARDVTERKLLEQQLEQANRVNSLGRLAATIAHEFNNVLMGMMPFAELLRRDEKRPELVARSTEHILNSIQRGKRVALDVLRFTQPAEPAVDCVALDAWWQHFQIEMRGRLKNSIRLEGVVDHVEIAADSLQLSQVFTNLIINAGDAMPSGGQLTVRAARVPANAVFPFGVVPHPDQFIHISFEDTGTGIDPELVRHVFDPLFTTKRNGGTGLGLAVTHQIVSRHGGHIFVESTVGVGTTFHVFLPRGTRKSGPEAVPPEPGRGSLHVLIVDDEPLIVAGLELQLEMHGFTVRSVTSGEAALEEIDQAPCDLVILDIGLPNMNGREVATRLRERYPRLPIIFATGHGDAKLIDSDTRMRLLRKPFRFAELMACISSVTAREEV